MCIGILRGIDANQRTERSGFVHIAVVSVGSADGQAVNPINVLHKRFLTDLPARTHRPEGSVAVFRVVGNQVGGICPHATGQRIFLVQGVSRVGIEGEIAVGGVGVTVGIVERAVAPAHPVYRPALTVRKDTHTQGLVVVAVSAGIVGGFLDALADFRTDDDI